MPKLMVANPLFRLKIARRKATLHTAPYRSASIDVKTGSPEFATTRPLIHWRVLAIRAMFGRPLAYRAVTAGSGRIKIR
jgi:hypothetical protein